MLSSVKTPKGKNPKSRVFNTVAITRETCECGKRCDKKGDHRVSCSSRVKLRATPLENMWARVLKEAGARVKPNVLLRDLNLGVTDNRNIEVVAYGLPLFGGLPIALDCTLVSVLHQDGSPWPKTAQESGVRAEACREEKEGTYPEFHNSGRARLVVAAMEVGGRWSEESCAFLRMLAASRASRLPPVLRRQATLGYLNRWSSMLACAAQRATAASLYDKDTQVYTGVADPIPTAVDVAGEARYIDGPEFSRLPSR